MIDDLGNVLVAIVGVKEIEAPVLGAHDERSCGNGFRGIPHVGVEKHVVGATELLDAEVVVVDEALECFRAILHRAHFDTAAHTVEGHRDHGVAGLPADGTILGIVGDRPHAGLGLDEGLVSIVVVLGREVVDGGVLVEIVGGVGLAFGGGTVSHLAYARGRMYSDVVVGIGNFVCGNQFITDVVAVLLVIDKNTATSKEGRSPL